nr:uncharacterized protein LOC129278240 [Lytechinus pictus]
MEGSTDEEVTFKVNSKSEDCVKMDSAKMQSDFMNRDDIRPEDSVSQRGSSSTTSASWRLRARARRAALQAEVMALQEQQELELEEIKLKQRKAELLLKMKLKVAEAEEAVYKGTQSDVKVKGKTDPLEQDKTEESCKLEPSRDNSTMPAKTKLTPTCDNSSTSESDKMMGKMHSDIFHHLQQGQKQHQQLLEAITISTANIMSFDGNPLKFYEFMRSFDSVIGRSSLDNNTKLLKLYHLCSGAAKDIIHCCLMMHPDDGYLHARTLLTDRFGNAFKICDAWIKKITEGPVIQNNPKQLREFADQLKTCGETLMAIGMLQEISCRNDLVKIIERLPFHLKSRWVRHVKSIRDVGRQPNIQDAVDFITGAADELNDPVFGTLLTGGPKSSSGGRTDKARALSGRGPVSTFTTISHSGENCILCNARHDLFGCQDFKNMKPENRFEFAFKNRLCFNCLLPGHISSRCNINRTCSVKGCNQRHTKFLHTGRGISSRRPTLSGINDSSTQTDSDVSSHASCDAMGAGVCRVALPIVPVTVSIPDGREPIETFALLDPGSTNSFCLQELADKIKTKGKRKIVKVSTLEAPNRIMECESVKLRVEGSAGASNKKIDVEFLTRPSLNISAGNMAVEEDISRYPHLTGIDLPVTRDSQVTLLIGQDVPDALLPLEVKAGAPGEVYAVKTALGWTLNGPLGNGGLQNFQASSSFISDAGNVLLEEQVHKFWKLEGTEYLHDEEKGMSVNDKKALKIWQEGVCRDGDHYQLPIPLAKRPDDLPSNIQVARNRLESLKRRLERETCLHAKYNEGMKALLEEGYAEEVPVEIPKKGEGVWYLPHHPVFNPNKPDKTRIVFDCASKCDGISLNDAVLQGPDLTNNLLGVLLRFRQEYVAIMGDIRAMFHQVRVPCEQRNLLRFLWWPEGDLTQHPKAYRMCVHLFGGTWSPSVCSFALRHTAEEHRADFSSKVLDVVSRNFYVDDCLVSCKTESDAIDLVAKLMLLLNKGGFQLTKWVSSSPDVIESVPVEDRAKNIVGLDLNRDALPVERALGVTWDVEQDCITYKIIPKGKPLTRRGILSEIASVYDPYGYASPFVLIAKKILQDLTALKLGFDDPIPDEYRTRWLKWKDCLPMMSNFRVNRCFKPSDETNKFQLHHFCDASESAYGVVSYLRMTSKRGQVHCSIILAKSRLAPLKRMTIPRLELMAATLAVTMDKKIRKELDFSMSESVFWTDSTIVLHYIGSKNKRFRTFVANRISAIQDASEPRQWRYVNTERNPADDASRGVSPDKLTGRWVQGPDFLWTDDTNWPVRPADLRGVLPDDLEMKPTIGGSSFATQSEEMPLESFINTYSSWFKLRRGVCWLLKFMRWLKLKGDPQMGQDLNDFKRISYDDMQDAEKRILHFVQKCYFQREMETLTNPTGRVTKSSQLYKLDPNIEENLIRVGGRLERSALPLDAKHPVILPKESHVSELILRDVHERAGHSGRNYVLAVLREKYWLLSAGTAIRSMISKCVICRRQRGKMMNQRMADLPENRLLPDEPPFSKVGIDYFGPFEVKRGRRREKRYGVMFTCLTVRAIHLEVAHSLDTDSCISAIRRFIARRGNVKEILSDNGTNLVGAERELKREIDGWNTAKISADLLQRNVKWTFNPPTASHFGGVWERQIGTVRKLVLSIAKQQVLSDESLLTLFCEIEGIVNNRPLTRVSDDVDDIEALTPNHLLLLNRKPHLPPTLTDKSDVYSKRRWRQVQYLADVFWRRWSREYLPQLQEREKWVSSHRNLQVGDLVLVADGNTPRNLWLLGRALKTFPDKKGFIRSAEIKTKNGMIVRPISKLCLILEGDQ